MNPTGEFSLKQLDLDLETERVFADKLSDPNRDGDGDLSNCCVDCTRNTQCNCDAFASFMQFYITTCC